MLFRRATFDLDAALHEIHVATLGPVLDVADIDERRAVNIATCLRSPGDVEPRRHDVIANENIIADIDSFRMYRETTRIMFLGSVGHFVISGSRLR
jgi:hypothetical protein